MKLRTDGQSVRLRVKHSEVAQLEKEGLVAVRVALPGRTLEFRLESGDFEALATSFDGQCIRVMVPRTEALAWCTTKQVGIYGEHASIAISIEKDFQRTTKASPDDDDRYPNPASPPKR